MTSMACGQNTAACDPILAATSWRSTAAHAPDSHLWPWIPARPARILVLAGQRRRRGAVFAMLLSGALLHMAAIEP